MLFSKILPISEAKTGQENANIKPFHRLSLSVLQPPSATDGAYYQGVRFLPASFPPLSSALHAVGPS